MDLMFNNYLYLFLALSHLQRKRTAKDVSRSGREMEKLGRSSAKKRRQGICEYYPLYSRCSNIAE